MGLKGPIFRKGFIAIEVMQKSGIIDKIETREMLKKGKSALKELKTLVK